MRELKFRAWDGESVRYDVTGFEHGHKNEMEGIFLDGDYYTMEIKKVDFPHALVMQYTCLKDKNGVEIYEGDIIKYHFNSDHQFNLSKVAYGYASDEGGELRESVGFFRVGLNAESYRYKDMEIEVYDCPTSLTYGKRRYEVIGNIYENPELINGAKQ